MERVSEVFLSATVKDTDHERAQYRRLARECLEKGGVAVFLQNHWVLPFAGVVSECRKRVSEASGYFGLFGFRYGWQPVAPGPSITEIEFDSAMERWSRLSHPPVFVFHPTRPSEAASALEEAADGVLAEEFSDEAERARNKAAQAAFVARIGGMGRIVQTFTDQIDFTQRASLAVPLYNGDLLRRNDRVGTRASIPSTELGAIGREEQLKALRRLLVALGERTPALCVVVHGREGWGQQELLDHLAHWPDWSCAGGPRLGRNREDLSALVAWSAVELGHTGPEAALDDLAELAVAACARDNPVLLLQQHGLASLEAFQRGFWQPLQSRILAHMPPRKAQKRLVVVVRHDRPLAEAGPDDAWTLERVAPDVAKLIALPECGAITAEQVQDWLFEQLPLDAAEIGALARRATTDPEGVADGTPHLVYQRLRDALPNWAELAAGDDR